MFIPRVQEIHRPILAEPVPVIDIVKKIAISCLKELAISLALGVVVAMFVPFAGGITLMVSAALVQVAVSAFFHGLGAYASNKIAEGGTNLKHFERILSVCEWITGVNFAIFTGFNAQTLIHESGHAMAALSVYKRARPAIEVYPFLGGITQFYKTSLTAFGKKLGPVAATCLIIASGPGFTLLISSVLFAIGLALKEKYPQFGKYLIAWGIIDFLNHAHYAYSALHADPSNLSHDFVHLAIFGLNPVTAAIGILAIPVIITIGVHCWQSRKPDPTPATVLAVV